MRLPIKYEKIFLPLIVITFLLGSILPLPWHNFIDNAWLSAMYKIRGDRDLSDTFLFVFLDNEDITDLDGWPITRDFYGYLIHQLRGKGAKVIGFDILLDKPAAKYEEHDEMLAEMIQAAGNICLPMAFAGFSKQSGAFTVGQAAVHPLPLFREHLAGIGFSNLANEAVQFRAPLVARDSADGNYYFSYGVAIARLFLEAGKPELTGNYLQLKSLNGRVTNIPLDDQGQLLLNHFGSLENVSAISFVELLQSAGNDTVDLRDKIVLVAATAPGLPVVRSTPLQSTFPASLLHLTVAENIISQNFLQVVPGYLNALLVLLTAALAVIIARIKSSRRRLFFAAATLLLSLLLVYAVFAYGNRVISFIYPALAFIAVLLYSHFTELRQREADWQGRESQLAASISDKTRDLRSARIELEKLNKALEGQSASYDDQKSHVQSQEKLIHRLAQELDALKADTRPTVAPKGADFANIIYAEDGPFAQVLRAVHQIRNDDITVLIIGETGTGKEMIARAVHDTSSRKEKPFIAVNCGALAENLLESELFGHEKGAFTGAQNRRKGRFELADGGTIFLDEITETSAAFQSRLLRVLQEGTFERLGSETSIKVDIRIIAASNRHLQTEIDSGRFRADLFYRLNGFPIALPLLNERQADIPLLADHFLKKYATGAAASISDQAMHLLANYPWPGNVRELENIIRRAVILAENANRSMIRSADLPDPLHSGTNSDQKDLNYLSLDEQILNSLRELQFSRSSITETARQLGNKDRGTITEYFRGICFQILTECDFDRQQAVRRIAASDDSQALTRVAKKLDRYLKNLSPFPRAENIAEEDVSSWPQFKGLPKKYHPYLRQVLLHLQKKNGGAN